MVKRTAALLLILFILCGCTEPPSDAGNNPPAGTTVAPAVTVAVPIPEQGATDAPAQPAQQAPDGISTLREGTLQVLFINVGKADAALILTGGKAYLIDTGENTSIAQTAAALAWAGVNRLSGVFLTHTHSDHIGGMQSLPLFVPIETVYRAEISENKKKGGNKIDEAAADAGAALELLVAGDSITLSDGVTAQVLGPLTYNETDDNDNSLVLRIEAFGRRILFTGDMQVMEEESLLNAGADLSADVLKVGNHGNPDATSEAFARAVSPFAAVVSTDTAVDADSDNPRVHAALPMAQMFCTEGTELGVLVTVEPDGTIHAGYPEKPAPSLSLALTEANRTEQRAAVRNEGETADVSGCFLVSERGGEVFVFPAGTVLETGTTVTTGCDDGCDFRFADEKSVFSKKKDDAMLLYDVHGNLLGRLEAS